VSLPPPNNVSPVSLTPVNSFSAVSLKPAKNLRLFGYFPVTPAINFSPVSLTPLNSLEIFIREYLREFSKNFKTAPMEYLGAWGTLIHEKTRSRKYRVRLPLKVDGNEK
jgi:hypothetical protein